MLKKTKWLDFVVEETSALLSPYQVIPRHHPSFFAKNCTPVFLDKPISIPVCIFGGNESKDRMYGYLMGDMSRYWWSLPGSDKVITGIWAIARKCDLEPQVNELGEVAP